MCAIFAPPDWTPSWGDWQLDNLDAPYLAPCGSVPDQVNEEFRRSTDRLTPAAR